MVYPDMLQHAYLRNLLQQVVMRNLICLTLRVSTNGFPVGSQSNDTFIHLSKNDRPSNSNNGNVQISMLAHNTCTTSYTPRCRIIDNDVIRQTEEMYSSTDNETRPIQCPETYLFELRRLCDDKYRYNMMSLNFNLAQRSAEFNYYLDRVFYDHLCASITPTMIHGGANPIISALQPLISDSETARISAHALTATYLAVIAAPASHSLTKALELKGEAIRNLSKQLRSPESVRSDSVLAATLFLAICEEVSSHTPL